MAVGRCWLLGSVAGDPDPDGTGTGAGSSLLCPSSVPAAAGGCRPGGEAARVLGS